MPELPEVESLVRALAPVAVGMKLTAVDFHRADLRQPIPIDEFRQRLVGAEIRAVERRAKYLLFKTEAAVGIFHLGMTGNIFCQKQVEPRLPHTHAVLSLSSASAAPVFLHFVDPRRFGQISCCSLAGLDAHPFLAKLGPEPLVSTFALGEHLWQESRGRTTPVKTFIMNAAVIVGVGNIYASEALFRARIHPDVAAASISKQRYLRLATSIRETLTEAIAQGGTSFRDFRHADGKPGYFRIALQVYDRTGEPCKRCGGKIAELRLAGRASFFCPRCQS